MEPRYRTTWLYGLAPLLRTREDEVCIYGLEDPRTGEIRYIGQSIKPYLRLGGHISEAWGYGPPLKAEWIKSLMGDRTPPIMRLLAIVPREQAGAAEEAWIAWAAARTDVCLNVHRHEPDRPDRHNARMEREMRGGVNEIE